MDSKETVQAYFNAFGNKQDWEQFRPYLKTFINKDLTILLGPSTSLAELSRKKIKRRSITLVRKVD